MRLILLALLLASCGQRELDSTIIGKLTPTESAGPVPAPRVRSLINEVKGPESVLYDPVQDCYFISNINGGHLTVDGNGFISRVEPDTMTVDLKWIEGGRNGVTLDAPKGMAVIGDALYISDVTAVRKFDRRTGAPRGEIRLPGASFINDITTDGRSLFISDTGVVMGPGDRFVTTGSEAIWQITGDRPKKIAAGRNLNQPNGLDYHDGKLWAVSFGSNEMYWVGDGKKQGVVKLPEGELDGIVHLRDGSVLVSSWREQAIYRGTDDEFSSLLEGIAAPADIGWDSKRNRLLVPRSASNQVTIHALR